MTHCMRAYQPDDFSKIREFLCRSLISNGLFQRNWHVARWDYWRWHVIENITHARLEDVVKIWEGQNGEIVAVLHPEANGVVFLEVSPDCRTVEIEEEMLAEAERSLSIENALGKREITVWAIHEDTLRENLLRTRGYLKLNTAEYMRWRDLNEPLPKVQFSEAYTIRAMQGDCDFPPRSLASWRAFHPDEPAEPEHDWFWYRNVQRADGYRQDLDLVAVARNGEIAGFCTVWFDQSTQTGMLEPVGVTPMHKRHGLGKALVVKGLTQLQKCGGVRAFVGSYGPVAHALYQSAGFTHYDLSFAWKKEL